MKEMAFFFFFKSHCKAGLTLSVPAAISVTHMPQALRLFRGVCAPDWRCKRSLLARAPCILAPSTGLQQKWSKIRNPNANSLSDKESTGPSKQAHSLGRLHSQSHRAEEELAQLFALLTVLHRPTQLGRPGTGAAPAPPPPHPDPFSKSPPMGCASHRSPTRLPKEVCCAVLQLQMWFPSFPQRAGTGFPRGNRHWKAAMRKAKRRVPGQPPNPRQYQPPNPAAPALCRHSTASAPAGLRSKAPYGGLGSTNAVFIPTSLHKIQGRKKRRNPGNPGHREAAVPKQSVKEAPKQTAQHGERRADPRRSLLGTRGSAVADGAFGIPGEPSDQGAGAVAWALPWAQALPGLTERNGNGAGPTNKTWWQDPVVSPCIHRSQSREKATPISLLQRRKLRQSLS